MIKNNSNSSKNETQNLNYLLKCSCYLIKCWQLSTKDNSWNLSFQFVSNGTDKSVRQIAGHFNSHLSTNIKVSLIYTYDAVGRSPLEYRGTAYYYSVSHLLNHYATTESIAGPTPGSTNPNISSRWEDAYSNNIVCYTTFPWSSAYTIRTSTRKLNNMTKAAIKTLIRCVVV